jgi:hypothetical protein
MLRAKLHLHSEVYSADNTKVALTGASTNRRLGEPVQHRRGPGKARQWLSGRQQTGPVPPSKALVLTWTPDQNASQLARALGAHLYVPIPGHSSFPAPIRYIVQAAQTALFIFRKRPRVIIYQDPPFVTGAFLIFLRSGLRFDICASAHSGPFNDPRWTRFKRFSRWVFTRCAGMFVHNELMLEWAHSFGVPTVLLRYPGFALASDVTFKPATPSEHILVPLSYRFDEPVRELLTAARSVPHIPLLLTGKAPNWAVQAAPANCQFTGWLDRARYEHLLATARGVVALTSMEHTAQMAAFEAVEHGVPVLTSGTKTLRQFHKAGAVFVADHEPATIAAGLERLWTDYMTLRPGAEDTRQEAIRESIDQLEGLRDMLGLTPSWSQ